MPRFIQYDVAALALSRMDTVTAEELRRFLDISPQAATSFIRRFVDEGLIELQEEATGRYRVLGRSRRRWGTTNVAAAPRDQHNPVAQATEIARLQAALAAMRERAERAEGAMASRGLRQEGNDGPMHDRLRRVLLRALHPDSQAHDEAARRVMDEVFRTLWPKVTRILEGKPDEGPAEVETHTSPAYPQPENRG